MRIYVGTDHAGYDLKQLLAGKLAAGGHEVVDCGAFELDPADDYPRFCIEAASRTAADPGSLGIVIGGSGNGEAIAANKVAGIRAALAYSEQTAQLAREHNDANVLALGARMYPPEQAVRFVQLFLTTPFSGDPRHQRRIDQIADYEQTR